MDPLLQVKNLQTVFNTEYGTINAVDGISYDLREGETLGLVGESGCGKSVSALSIMGLIPSPPGKVVNGEVNFNGRDLLKMTPEEVRKIRGNEIAMIFQEPMTSLNPVLTIGRQIIEPLMIHKGQSKDTARKNGIELLKRVKIPGAEVRMTAFPHQFSGGMRQRVMIAMGLSCNPKIIIADEPTTALDVTIQAQLLRLMKGLTREFGTALIIITHNLGIVAKYADRVNVMYAGRIIEKASAKRLYADPKHPYTVGLLASVPRLDQNVKKKLLPITGEPPNLINLPPGCSFASRCQYVKEKCLEERPVLRPAADDHEFACWIDVRANQ
ncbi:MAG: ABC transporter ATP-binding protein [Deltaproteobacteria bacterium]|nr:ABC transporter ATP-binding protein [Deltaproteobacteria bacterium]